jgi:hypothetical protein
MGLMNASALPQGKTYDEAVQQSGNEAERIRRVSQELRVTQVFRRELLDRFQGPLR